MACEEEVAAAGFWDWFWRLLEGMWGVKASRDIFAGVGWAVCSLWVGGGLVVGWCAGVLVVLCLLAQSGCWSLRESRDL